MENILDLKSSESDRGYWDINWNFPEDQGRHQLLKCSEYSVIQMSNELLEVSFKRTYVPSTESTKLPLSFDIRYLMKSGVSGFHCYAICERPAGCCAFDPVETKMVFKLRREKFHYMAISDEKQRIMPIPEDLIPDRGKQLIIPESVLLVNPINSDLKGEVDDRYYYAVDHKDCGVYGWVSSSPIIGIWIIFPSHESRSGGLTKQNLTIHIGPACLAMFHGTDYIGDEMVTNFQEGEEWKKDFGPIFVYLNSTSVVSNAYNLWTDAKKQRLLEEEAWPYDLISSPYYLSVKDRDSATGRLCVQDRLSEQTFTIGVSDPRKYWFFAHVGRRWAQNKYVPSTWTIKFHLSSVTNGIYKLRLAIASATHSNLKIYVNNADANHMVFQVINFGSDDTICRHGIHGLYRLFSIDISSSLLLKGDNSLFLTQARGEDAISGILYDYLRLEGPTSQEKSQQHLVESFTFDA